MPMIPFANAFPSIPDTGAIVDLLAGGALRASLLLIAAAVLCAPLRRRSAALRHLVWVAALASTLALPVLSAVLPEWPVLPAWSGHSQIAQRSAAEIGSASRLGGESSAFVPATPKPQATPAAPRSQPETSTARTAGVGGIVLVTLWGIGAASTLIRLLRTTCRVARLAGSSPTVVDGPLAEATTRIAARLRVAAPTIHLGPVGAVPMVWGLRRPRLLLPREAAAWEATRLAAVITHELAHLRRNDLQTLLVAHVARALHWFNPLAWYAVGRLRIEQERACDDYVLREGIRASDYAAHLVGVAAQLSPLPVPNAVVVAMVDSSRLEGRVRTILDAARNRAAPTRGICTLLFAATCAAAVLLSVLRANTMPGFQATGSVHWGTNHASAMVFHVEEQVAFALVHQGEFVSGSASTQNRRSRTWRDTGTIRLRKDGPPFGFFRTSAAPDRLTINDNTYSLRDGRVFLLDRDGTVRQVSLQNLSKPTSHADVAKLLEEAIAADAKTIAALSDEKREPKNTDAGARSDTEEGIEEPERGSDLLRKTRRNANPILESMASEHGYGLVSGQYLRRVPPPFPAIRLEYYRTGHPSQADAIKNPPAAMVFRWKDGRLVYWGMTFGDPKTGGYDLAGVLDALLEIKTQFIEGPKDLLAKRIPGDWVIQPGLADAKTIAVRQLEKILRDELSLPIRMGFREVEREVYVATGEYQHHPLPGREAKSKLILTDETHETERVEIFGKELAPENSAGGGSGPFPEFLDWLGRWIFVPVVSEVQALPTNWISWRQYERVGPFTKKSQEEDRDPKLVLPNITAQTGLKFTKAKRPVRILFVERVK